MDIFKKDIIPYIGTDSFKLYELYDTIIQKLEDNNILFSQDIWQDDSESVPDPWKVVHIPNIMLLFFASNNKLFKIVFLEEYEGTLSNGISTNMVLNEARRIDNSIQYNDWDEIYESEGGYWIEVSTGEETIMSISVFIKEIDDEKFELGLW